MFKWPLPKFHFSFFLLPNIEQNKSECGSGIIYLGFKRFLTLIVQTEVW